MDLGLPGIDGLQATRSLRREARTRHIPIVVLTGFVQPAYEDLALDAGCDALLSKPCPAEQLLQVIERLISSRATVKYQDRGGTVLPGRGCHHSRLR
jgi:CheY-like chemotaxis protein